MDSTLCASFITGFVGDPIIFGLFIFVFAFVFIFTFIFELILFVIVFVFIGLLSDKVLERNGFKTFKVFGVLFETFELIETLGVCKTLF